MLIVKYEVNYKVRNELYEQTRTEYKHTNNANTSKQTNRNAIRKNKQELDIM